MALTSLYKISEQVRDVLQKGAIQSYLSSVVDCYSSLVKREFFENKADGVSEVDGAFVYNFKPITPSLDILTEQYFITIPSSYLRLPHELGIIFIGYTNSSGFVRLTSGSSTMYRGLKSFLMGGNQTYLVEGTKIYFPRMTSLNVNDIVCKLAIAYDNVDPREELNIPRSVVNEVVNMVVAKYAPSPPNIIEKIK